MRTVIQRLVRGRSFKRHLPQQFDRVPIYVSPDSQLKYLRPSAAGFDQMLLDFAVEFVSPGDNVWDIGANVGVFTFASAARSKTGQVLAVEPDPFLASLLRRSAGIQTNQRLNVHVLSAAVSDRIGVACFAIAVKGRASNFLKSVGGRSVTGGIREELMVPTITLDLLLETQSPPRVLKIDVEGAEKLVLDGAPRLLTEIRPIILIEVGMRDREAIGQMLHNHEYLLFDTAGGNRSRPVIEVPAFNTLAVPREKPLRDP